MSLKYKDINTQSAVIVFSPVLSVETQIRSLSVQGEENFLCEMTKSRNILYFLLGVGSEDKA